MTATLTKPDWKVPAAKLVLPADAPEIDWLKQRRHGIGGSEIATITGTSTYDSPYSLWLDKTSLDDPESEDNDLFWYGHAVEPILAERFTRDTGITTRNVGMYANRERPWMFANPDRLTSDGGILEIKSTSRYTDNGKSYLAGIVPPAHLEQCLWYMTVTGRRQAHVIAIVDRQVIILTVEYDADHVEYLVDCGRRFWHHVETGNPPPVDLATVTPDEVSARYPEVIDPDSVAEAIIPESVAEDAADLAALKSDKKDIEDEIKAVETRLKAQIGDKEYLAVDGRPVARWQSVAGRRSFDKTAVLEKIAADRGLDPTKQNLKTIEAEYTKTGAPTRRLTLIEGSAA